MKKSIALSVRSLENLKTVKYLSYIFDKTLVLSIISDKCGNKGEEVFEKEDLTEILKFFV